MTEYRADNITVLYGTRTILSDVSLALSPGELIVLVGPNGAGKSTLLKTLAGEIPPSSGTVTLEEKPIHAMRPAALAARRAVLAQSSHLSFPFTVHEVVRLGLSGRPRHHQTTATVEAALGRVDLAGFGGRHYHELSGGERQRVHLARVLCQVPAPLPGETPRYLFLDEPTAGLDLKHQAMILRIARDFASAGGGVLAVLHDLNLAATFADRIAVIEGGRVAAIGTPGEVITDEILHRSFDVALDVSRTPAAEMPFVLPQTIRDGRVYQPAA